MLVKLAVVTGLALALIACAKKVALVPTGGSRADGTVTLSYEIGDMQRAEMDPAQAQAAARERCTAWGYSDAQAFGGQTRQCQMAGQYGCYRWFVSMTYQCLGRG